MSTQNLQRTSKENIFLGSFLVLLGILSIPAIIVLCPAFNADINTTFEKMAVVMFAFIAFLQIIVGCIFLQDVPIKTETKSNLRSES